MSDIAADRARVWLITGCSTGFGRELVRAAVAAGDRVMTTARRPEVLAELVELGRGRVGTCTLRRPVNDASFTGLSFLDRSAYRPAEHRKRLTMAPPDPAPDHLT
jgi:NAD(P)-dependent dehydrogenase (short-subunit alcohol dehydrogenase family)